MKTNLFIQPKKNNRKLAFSLLALFALALFMVGCDELENVTFEGAAGVQETLVAEAVGNDDAAATPEPDEVVIEEPEIVPVEESGPVGKIVYIAKMDDGVQRITGLLSAYFNDMQEAISRFGGIVSRIDPYSKGTKLLALFGAPVAYISFAIEPNL